MGNPELFADNFGKWLEANGLKMEATQGPLGGYYLYAPGPIDLNALKLATWELIEYYRHGKWNDVRAVGERLAELGVDWHA